MEHSVDGGTFNQILTINQGCVFSTKQKIGSIIFTFLVFDILLTYITDKNWSEALKKNVPERKGWVLKKAVE